MSTSSPASRKYCFRSDWQTLAVIAVLCAIAAYFIKEYLANPPMIIFVYPVLVFFSLLAQYLFIVTEQFRPRSSTSG